MALLFISSTDDPDAWLSTLAAELPDLEMRVWPQMGDAGTIRYALVWNPPRGLLASLPNLKAVLSLGAGVDALLADPTLPPDLPVVRLVEPGLTAGMTEYVVWQALAWHRNERAYRTQQAEGRWQKCREQLAWQRSVAVMGLGEMGLAAARALAALGFRVSGWSRTPRRIDGIDCHAGWAGLDAFLAAAECLVCLLPLTGETQGILNAGVFARMPRGAHLINAGRGGHLVEADLLDALASGQLGGAALDVFTHEPLPPGHPFWSHPHITVTPHVAAVTHGHTAAPSIAAAIRELDQGRLPPQTVDRQRGY